MRESDMECTCGVEPWTDGMLCPACLPVLVNETTEAMRKGEIGSDEGFRKLMMATRIFHDDDDTDTRGPRAALATDPDTNKTA